MFHFTTQAIDFDLPDEADVVSWLKKCIQKEEKFPGTLTFTFCSDEYLLEKNQQFLDHDTFTDIITFDYCEGDVLNGDILISIDRVRENAGDLKTDFEEELQRVMAHGLLHLCGYGDKGEEEMKMRAKEEEWLSYFDQSL